MAPILEPIYGNELEKTDYFFSLDWQPGDLIVPKIKQLAWGATFDLFLILKAWDGNRYLVYDFSRKMKCSVYNTRMYKKIS